MLASSFPFVLNCSLGNNWHYTDIEDVMDSVSSRITLLFFNEIHGE